MSFLPIGRFYSLLALAMVLSVAPSWGYTLIGNIYEGPAVELPAGEDPEPVVLSASGLSTPNNEDGTSTLANFHFERNWSGGDHPPTPYGGAISQTNRHYQWCARYSGMVTAPVTGSYRIKINDVDDWVQVRVDGEKKAGYLLPSFSWNPNYDPGEPNNPEALVDLNAGEHVIDVLFFQGYGWSYAIDTGAYFSLDISLLQGGLSIRTFNDLNQNGTRDAGEPETSDFPVSYAGNVSGGGVSPLSATVPAGTYTVSEGTRAGWVTTTPNPVTVQVVENQTTEVWFGNYQYGKIFGYKRDDINADGPAGSNPGLEDWTIQLYRNGAYYGSDDTDENGYYEFPNLPAGTYTVKEVVKNNWYPTDPDTGEYTGIVMTSGAQIQRDFYNFKKGSIEVFKWQDMNEDRYRDGGDNPLSGWDITLTCLTGADAGQSWTKSTNSNGKVLFTDLSYGQYRIAEAIPDGWRQTYPFKETGSLTHLVTITSGLDLPAGGTRTDFGNYQYGGIEVLKWQDTNENGEREAGDTPLSGWSITLTCQSGDAKDQQWTKTTGIDGKVYFDDLHAGDYTIEETLPDDWVQTYPLKKTGNSTHEVTITSGLELPAGEVRTDFGNFKLVEIIASKWDDSNADGLKNDGPLNDGKSPLSDWTIVLTCKTGTEAGRTWEDETGADGTVKFTGLHYGTYILAEQMKDDWRQTVPFPGNKSMPDEGELGDGVYGPYEITSGMTLPQTTPVEMRTDFGNVRLGDATKIVQHYWWDWLMSGFDVSLREVTVPEWIDNVIDFPTAGTTGDDGSVCIDNLLPGRYQFVLTLPAGWCEDSVDSDTFDLVEHGKPPVVVNKVYDNPRREPRTLGYWKNWRLHYTPEEMQVFIALVKVGSNNFGTLTLANLDAAINPANQKKVSMEDMARMQYLALWLNLASQRLGFTPVVDLTPISDWPSIIEDNYGAVDGVMTIHELMKELVRVYNGGLLTKKADLEAFKDICDAVNNYRVFQDPPTGATD